MIMTKSSRIKKRVGIWIRVSTEDQAQGDSPEHHEKRARYYAEAKEWNIVEVYHLEGVSGKSVADHPETKRMLDDIKRGHINALIFSKLARLARNTRDLLDFAEYFQEHDADLVSLQESIDTSTPSGRLFYTVIAAMAQWEREEISDRVAASIPIRAKLGKPLGGQAPYGYQWNNGKLEPDPHEAPVRRLMHELFAEHKRLKTVARLLNEAGHRTRKGSKFSDTTVSRLIQDPIAKGVRRANYTKSTGDGKKWITKPESEWVLVEVEPIVSEELWNQCNAIFEQRRTTRKPPGRKPVQLFGGLVICQCGTKMYKPSNMRKYVCNKCKNKIPVNDLEAIYQEQLKAFLLSPEELKRYVIGAEERIQQQNQLLASIRKEKQKLDRDIDEMFRLHSDGEIPTKGFGKKYQPLQDRVDQIEQEIPQIEAEIDFLTVNLLSHDQVQNEAKTLADQWDTFDTPQKRTIVETITDNIVIGKDTVNINLWYLPISFKNGTKRQHNPRVSWLRRRNSPAQ